MSAIHEHAQYEDLRRAVSLGLFVGTGVGLGYLLAGLPGLELMSLNAALAGATLGPVLGPAAGAGAVVIYSLGSPFGPPIPLLLLAQAIGMALCGLAGAWLAPILRRWPPLAAGGLAALAGLGSAVVLDLLTNVAAAVSFDLPLAATLLAGLPVAAVHAATTAAAFGLLLPSLGRRLRSLLRRGPRSAPVLCLVALSLATAAAAAHEQDPLPLPADADTLAADPSAADGERPHVAVPDSLVDGRREPPAAGERMRPARRRVNGWQRPLWRPFAGSLREDLQRHGPWLVVADGGQGAAVVQFGEPGTSATPVWMRDGLPLGHGHRYLDDPEALVATGHDLHDGGMGLAPDGSLAGLVGLSPRDPTPDRDLLDTRWTKGPHETYLRDVHFLTARAPWRLGFAFGEVLDNEGYDFRVAGESRYQELDEPEPLLRGVLWGRAKLRSGRGIIRRDLGEAGSLAVSLENVRKLRLALPAYGIEHQDHWHNRVAVDWRPAAGGRSGRLAFWWLETDVDWNRGRASYRKQEGSTSGVLGAWGDADDGGRLEATWRRWIHVDSGAAASWAGADTGRVRLRGEGASLHAARRWDLGPAALDLGAGGWWDRYGGWLVGGGAGLADPRLRPRWTLRLERGGRAPRWDELATAWRFTVPDGRQTVALGAPGLDREDEWRLAASLRSRAAGFDLALSGALRRLRDGIGWRPLEAGGATGRWQNGLALDSATVRAGLKREGRCLGWLRLEADAAWRTWRRRGDLAVALPPAWNWRLAVLWEQHFFREDGILELGWYLHNRGPLDDPWLLSEPYRLPAATALDMVVGFRLVGTDLGLELLNLAGGGSRLSAGAVAPGLEMRWRLHWTFQY